MSRPSNTFKLQRIGLYTKGRVCRFRDNEKVELNGSILALKGTPPPNKVTLYQFQLFLMDIKAFTIKSVVHTFAVVGSAMQQRWSASGPKRPKVLSRCMVHLSSKSLLI